MKYQAHTSYRRRQVIKLILAALVGITGLVLIRQQTSWQVALGVFLFGWSIRID